MLTYNGLLKKSLCSYRFLKKLSLLSRAKRSRIASYIKLITSLNDAFHSGTISRFLEKKNSYFKSSFALKELFEFVSILEQIQKLYKLADKNQKEQIKNRIEIILSGPVFTKSETSKNSKARNYQFELLLTSRLFTSGIKNVQLLENPDILATIGDRVYAVECKRVTGNFKTALISRVNEAVSQIKKYKRNNNIFSGIVAIDLSAKYEQGHRHLKSISRNSAERYVQKNLESDLIFVYKNSHKLVKEAKNNLIAGLIGNISGVYVLGHELGWINEISILVLNKENIFRGPIFKSDFNSLRKRNFFIS